MMFEHPLLALKHWSETNPDGVYLRQPVAGQFQDYTWAEVAEQAQKMASALQAMGFEAGDRVAILSKNCVQWFIADYAIMLANLVSVPIYASANSDTIHYVLKHSEAKAIFVGNLDNWSEQAKGIEADVLRIAFPYDTMPAAMQWQKLLKNNQPMAFAEHYDPTDKMSIIYTSGSTGEPKGVVMTCGAYAQAANNICSILAVEAGDRAMSYLPLAHITERVYIQGTSLMSGSIQVAFVESLATFNDNLKFIKPTLFLSVPRLWLKFQQSILEKMPQQKLNFLLKIPFVKGMVKNKIKQALGLEKARLLGCGSAAVSSELLLWYQRLDINICQAWGMSETLAYGTLNVPFNKDKIGSVGRVGPGGEIKLSEAGELLFKSDAMTEKYYLQPELSRDLFTEDGFIRTGDKAEIDEEGFMTITGRIKDIFKTAKGKYVMPVPIEAKFEDSPLIDQVCVTGAGLPQPIAFVVLAEEVKQQDQTSLNQALTELLNTINGKLESHERLDRVIVMAQPWSIENGLLTPTLKVRRHLVEETYKHLFEVEEKPIYWSQD